LYALVWLCCYCLRIVSILPNYVSIAAPSLFLGTISNTIQHYLIPELFSNPIVSIAVRLVLCFGLFVYFGWSHSFISRHHTTSRTILAQLSNSTTPHTLLQHYSIFRLYVSALSHTLFYLSVATHYFATCRFLLFCFGVLLWCFVGCSLILCWCSISFSIVSYFFSNLHTLFWHALILCCFASFYFGFVWFGSSCLLFYLALVSNSRLARCFLFWGSGAILCLCSSLGFAILSAYGHCGFRLLFGIVLFGSSYSISILG